MHGKDEIIWSYETCATCAASESAQALTSECPGAKCVPWLVPGAKSSARAQLVRGPWCCFFFWHDWCNCYHTYVHSTAECSLCKAVIWNLCINNVVANRADAEWDWGDDGPACSWSSVRHSVTAWHSKIGVPCLGAPGGTAKQSLPEGAPSWWLL